MENTALIDDLNDHCLKHIFSFLSIKEKLGIEKVCKRWRRIGEEGWNDIKQLEIVSDYSDDIIRVILKRCGRFLRKLKIDELIIVHPDSLSMVIKFCQLDQLEEIEIEMPRYERSDVNFDPSNLREIFEKSRKLVVVRISGYLVVSELDYLDFLNSETLQKLELCGNCTRISINPDQFPNLKELFLKEIKIIEDEMMRTEKSLEKLEKAWFYFCDLPEKFIQRIWTFKNLQVLGLGSLDGGHNINNEHIRHIAGYCDKIKKMSLSHLRSVTSKCFQYLGKMPSLEVFNFTTLDRVNSHDVVYLTNVKTLDFNYCRGVVEDVGLIELIVNSSNLEILTLTNMYMRRSFLNAIGRIFQFCQRKKHLIFILKYDDCTCDVGEIPPCIFRSDDDSCLKKITYHPLLDSRVNIELLESDDDLVE